MSSARRHNKLRIKNANYNGKINDAKYLLKNPIKYEVPIVPDLSSSSLNKKIDGKNKYYCNSSSVSEYGDKSSYLQSANETNKSVTNFKYATLGRTKSNKGFDENQHLELSCNETNELKSSKSFSCSSKNFAINSEFLNENFSNCLKKTNTIKENIKNNNNNSLLTLASVKFPSTSSFSINNYNLINKQSLDDSILLKSQQSNYSNYFSNLSTNQKAYCYNALVEQDLSKLNKNNHSVNLPLFSQFSSQNFGENNSNAFLKYPNQLESEKYLPYISPRILNINVCQRENLKQKYEKNANENFIIAANKSDKIFKSSLFLPSSSKDLHTTNITNNNNNKSQNNIKNITKHENNKTYENIQGDNTNDIDRFTAGFDEAQNFQGEIDVKKMTNINTTKNCINSITQNNCNNAIKNNIKILNDETKQNSGNFNNKNQILDNNTTIDCFQCDQHWKGEKGI